MKEAFVGLIVQLRLGPEFGPEDGMGDRDGLINALRGFLGEWPCTDSGSRSTNIKCWDIPRTLGGGAAVRHRGGRGPGVVESGADRSPGLLECRGGRGLRVGPERVVWPEDRA